MLTVKHVEASGHEHVTSALEVGYQPENAGGAGSPPILFAHGVPGPDAGARRDGMIQYADGKVYVMNESGKTVATYDLDAARARVRDGDDRLPTIYGREAAR